MKKRILGAILVVTFLITSLFLGKKVFMITMTLIALLGLKELIDIKYEKKNLNLIKILSYIFLTIMLTNKMIFKLDNNLLLILPIVGLLLPLIFYNDFDLYDINDAFYFLGILYFMYFSFNTIIYLESISVSKCIYIFIISFITDTYAYIGGKLIGKHKFSSISPKKTVEGLITGTFIGTFMGSMYYINYINDLSIIKVILLSFLLTILSELGDLVFSSIKRCFNKKDYANLIPGHGGILDRFDSVIFVALGISIFLSIF